MTDITANEKIPLSNVDIMYALHNQIRIVYYHDLALVHSIMELFIPFNKFILLYELGSGVGHWVTCIFHPDKQLIEHFDSYGAMPDAEIKMSYNQPRLYYSALLKNGPYPVEWNKHQLQAKREHINTCGRYCILRAQLSDLTNEEFYNKIFNNKKFKNIPNDQLVTILTMTSHHPMNSMLVHNYIRNVL